MVVVVYNKIKNLNTYIIGLFNPTFRIIDLVSYTIYVVYGNFYTWVVGSTV